MSGKEMISLCWRHRYDIVLLLSTKGRWSTLLHSQWSTVCVHQYNVVLWKCIILFKEGASAEEIWKLVVYFLSNMTLLYKSEFSWHSHLFITNFKYQSNKTIAFKKCTASWLFEVNWMSNVTIVCSQWDWRNKCCVGIESFLRNISYRQKPAVFRLWYSTMNFFYQSDIMLVGN